MGLRAVAVLALVAGCYDVPMPVCGFSCVEEGECPDGYTCDSRGDRFCHLNGTVETCPGHEGVQFDNTPPGIVDITPNQGVLQTFDSIIVTFDESVFGVSAESFFLTKNATEERLGQLSEQQNRWVLLPPSLGYPSGQSFTLTLTDEIRDIAGNELTPTSFEFATPTLTPPMLTGSVPGNSQNGVSVGVLLQLFFDKPATNIVSKFRVTDALGNPVVFSANPTADTISPFFNLRWQLTANSTYTLIIDPGVTSLDGLATTDGTAFQFRTGADTVGPRLWARSPGLFSVNTPVSAGVRIDFDEDAQNVVDGSVVLQKNGVAVPGKLTYDTPARSVTLRLDNQLAPSTLYDVVLSPAITDAFGNQLADTGWSFQTGLDQIPPQIRTTVPHTASINAPVDTAITITFDEPTTGLDASTFFVTDADGAVTGSLVATNGNRTWTFTPDAALSPMAEIDVDVELATDLFGNSTNYFYSFTTGP